MSFNDQETFNESNNSEYLNKSNFSDYYERPGPTFFESSVFTMILYCTLSLGVLGNFTTILYITCSKHLHTPTFITICSLAITDLTVVVISLFVKMYDNDKFFEGNVLFVALLVLYIAMINTSADVVFLFSSDSFWLCIRSSVDSTSQIHLSSVHCWSYGDTAFLLFLLFLLSWTALYHWFMKKPKVQI